MSENTKLIIKDIGSYTLKEAVTICQTHGCNCFCPFYSTDYKDCRINSIYPESWDINTNTEKQNDT